MPGLLANTTNQSNAIMIRSHYNTLPHEIIMYNALSGDDTSNYAHYERTTIGWTSMSAVSAFSINVTAAGNGVSHDLYITASSANKIVLQAGGLSAPTSLKKVGAVGTTTTYMLAPSDNGTVIATLGNANYTSNTYIQFNSNLYAYPIGFNVGLLNLGQGTITLSGTQAINNSAGLNVMQTQYAAATLMYTGRAQATPAGADWVAFGQLG